MLVPVMMHVEPQGGSAPPAAADVAASAAAFLVSIPWGGNGYGWEVTSVTAAVATTAGSGAGKGPPGPAGFVLDEAAASAWLARATRQADGTAALDGLDRDSALPAISAGWRPATDGGSGPVNELLAQAADAGILTRPEAWEIAYEYASDADGQGYRWLLVSRDENLPLIVADAFADCWPPAEGAEAALEMLGDAVAAGNELLTDLACYAAAQQATRAQDPARADDAPPGTAAGLGLAAGVRPVPGQDELSDAAATVTAAARLVVDRWESGDLATAVTELARALAWLDDDSAAQPGRVPDPGAVLRLCDGCYQGATGLPAECADGCPQDLDHEGLCLRRSDPHCQWCGRSDRLHEVIRAEAEPNLPTVGEANEGQWSLRWPGEEAGSYPSAEAAWDAWHATTWPPRVAAGPGTVDRVPGRRPAEAEEAGPDA